MPSPVRVLGPARHAAAVAEAEAAAAGQGMGRSGMFRDQAAIQAGMVPGMPAVGAPPNAANLKLSIDPNAAQDMQSHAAMRKLMGFEPEVDPRVSLVQPGMLNIFNNKRET